MNEEYQLASGMGIAPWAHSRGRLVREDLGNSVSHGRSLMEQSFNDGEVVVQAGRSAKVVNMIQKFIHKASLPFG